MRQPTHAINILLADDDPEDRMLAQDALRESRILNELHMVSDGEELMEYLRGEGRYRDNPQPRPGVILLDLNMPRMTGHEALAEIRKDAKLRQIPIVALTTSQDQMDIFKSYDLGVNSYVTKPVSFDGLVSVMKTLDRYWFQLVDLPPRVEGRI